MDCVAEVPQSQAVGRAQVILNPPEEKLEPENAMWPGEISVCVCVAKHYFGEVVADQEQA